MPASPTTVHRGATTTTTFASARPTAAPPTTGPAVVTTSGAVLPNPSRTPGARNPDVTQADIGSTICVSGWTSTIRPPSSYTTGLKEQQLASGYSYEGDTNPGDYEEDHLISLELGGSPTSPLNLWPEPYFVADGAHMKDQIENKLHELVCEGTLSLAAAQQAIAANWFVAYQTYIGPAATTSPTAVSTGTAPSSASGSGVSCTASMSNSAPTDYSTVDVIVHTGVAGASVTTTAHYKSTDTTHTATAGSNAVAEVPYDIGRATVGYQVTVDVSVAAAGATRTCSTSFTPR